MSNERRQAQETKEEQSLFDTERPDMNKKWRRLARVRNWLIGVWFGGIVGSILLSPLMGVFPSIKYQILAAMCVLTICWFGAVCGILLLTSSHLEFHVRETFRRKDVANLGCWIDILFAPASAICLSKKTPKYQPIYEAARNGLLEQLPLLQEETAHLLTVSERHALYKSLGGDDAELISVVLGALPLIGDARALPFVRRLAEGKGPAAGNMELQTKAQSSLHQLQARLDGSSGAQALLRASHHPQAPEEQLLKPAHANNDADADELMRADAQP